MDIAHACFSAFGDVNYCHVVGYSVVSMLNFSPQHKLKLSTPSSVEVDGGMVELNSC